MYITLHCSHQSFVTMYCSRRPTVSSPLLLLLLVLYHSQISSCLSVERVLDQDRGDGGAEEVQLPALERFTPAQLAAIAAGAGALLPFPGNHNNEVLKLPEVRDGNSAVLPKGRGDEHDGHGEVAARHGNHGQEAPPSGRHRDHGKGEQPAAGRHELHEGDKLPVERNDPPTTAAARILYAEGEGKSGHKGHSLVKRWAFRTADEPLCKQFPGHTMCKPKVGPACKESTNGKGFTEAEKKEMVKLSNDVRRKFASKGQAGWPGAADMAELTWNPDLAMVAQRHADQCVFAHDKSKQRQLPEQKKVGQNLWYGASSSKDHPASLPVKTAVDMWYAEIGQYNAKPPGYNSNHASGHLTQLIWGETSLVGCGYSFYRDEPHHMWDQLIVCNYARAGNRKKHNIYTSGDACSACPAGSKCHESLCLAA